MDIREFFELCEGQWVSQRTLHHIQTEQTDVSKADLWIEKVASDMPRVAEACRKFNLPIEQMLFPLEITYKATLMNGRSQIASTLMIPVSTSATTGQLISVPQNQTPVLGTFALGEDDVMTLTNSNGDSEVIERIWYASENLRIRSVTQINANGPTEANFCSEIRRMGAVQEKPTEEAAQQQLSPLAAWRNKQAQS